MTIFEGADGVPRDDEAEQYWIEAGVPKERIYQYGLKDNFWQMGETGPCGPCSEIFYDMGIEAAEHPGVDKPFGHDDARYVEIWNLVFMQFERSALPGSGKTAGYKLAPLPKPSIDTGMGLERVAAVLQGKVSNFETDLFTPLIARAAELAGSAELGGDKSGELASWRVGKLAGLVENASLRIIADHARAATFLINDGVLPSNEGRGYVLRKILRRGIRHGRLLGQEKPFLFQMVFAVRDLMQSAYPELVESADRVAKVVEAEEKQFDRVLKIGLGELNDQLSLARAETDSAKLRVLQKYEQAISDSVKGKGDEIEHEVYSELVNARKFFEDNNENISFHKQLVLRHLGAPALVQLEDEYEIALNARAELTGARAFHLYETFGLPLDFMVDAARDAGVSFDEAGFEAARAEEQARARASWKGGSQKTASPAFRDLPKTVFEGYNQLNSSNCEVLAIVKNGVGVPAAAAGDEVEIVLDHTSFYGDSGGQVGDTGFLLALDGNSTVAEITGCVLPVQGVRAHRAVLRQPLAVGDRVNTVVDGERRNAIRRNHTGTHLLHAALRQVLGTHVKQAGSAVDPDAAALRLFALRAGGRRGAGGDRVHRQPRSAGQRARRDSGRRAHRRGRERVPRHGAVRREVRRQGARGEALRRFLHGAMRRHAHQRHRRDRPDQNCQRRLGLLRRAPPGGHQRPGLAGHLPPRLRGGPSWSDNSFPPAGQPVGRAFAPRLAAQEDELKRLRRELEETRMKSAAGALDEALAHAVEVKGVRLVTFRADNLERGQLRTLVDNLKQKLGEGVVVLASAQPEGKVAIIAGVTPGLTKRIQAGKLVGAVAKLVGGSGGGKPEIAEAGGKDQTQIEAALKAAPALAGEMLG